AASGGVGFAAAQLARETGARVIGTASTENHEKLENIGAEAVAYGEGLVERVRQLAPDGVAAAADFVGGVRGDGLALRDEGGRHSATADSTVEGAGGRWVCVRPHGSRLRTLLEPVAAGTRQAAIDRSFPLVHAAADLEVCKAGEANGKLLIDA